MPETRDAGAFPEQVIQGTDTATRLPYGVTRFYASLAASADPSIDPIAAQYVPSPQEAVTLPYESSDPIGDSRWMAAPRLVHHYHDRVLLLVNDRCAVYCRHCFRRHFTGNGGGKVSATEMEEICAYLARTPAVREVLLSGGDPLMLSDQDLDAIIRRLRTVDPAYLIRICTRLPVVLPSRITPGLAAMLDAHGAIWMVIQVNHPREVTAELRAAVRVLLGAGVPVANQAVLLRGVNDDPDTLEALFRGLLRAGVKPYYLFQGDLASGTSHFRVPLERGIELMRILRGRLSGLALPQYAVDLPGGAGKVPVEASLVRTEQDAYVLRAADGTEHRYPRELPPA
jgi:lysine 2,3-aminomutase